MRLTARCRTPASSGPSAAPHVFSRTHPPTEIIGLGYHGATLHDSTLTTAIHRPPQNHNDLFRNSSTCAANSSTFYIVSISTRALQYLESGSILCIDRTYGRTASASLEELVAQRCRLFLLRHHSSGPGTSSGSSTSPMILSQRGPEAQEPSNSSSCTGSWRHPPEPHCFQEPAPSHSPCSPARGTLADISITILSTSPFP